MKVTFFLSCPQELLLLYCCCSSPLWQEYFLFLHRFSRNSFQCTNLVLYFRTFFSQFITECFLLTLSFLIFRNVNFYEDFFVFFYISSILWTYIFLFFPILLYVTFWSPSSGSLILLLAMPYFSLSLLDCNFYFCGSFSDKLQFFLQVCQLTSQLFALAFSF